MSPAPRRPGRPRTLGCLALGLALVVVAVTFGWRLLHGPDGSTLLPDPEGCVATAGNGSVALDLDQAHFASVIAAVAVDRGLPARAASIALTTAYQESDLRNLDHGDRDSVGLFQQRPSQGWGTVAQIRDPGYASGRFYDALVEIAGWQSDDINDVAQRVQRSGYPEAYRDHEADGRTLASVLTGYSPAGLSCLQRSGAGGDARGLTAVIESRFATARARRSGRVVTVRADTARDAWVYAHFAVANAGRYGVATVRVGDRLWTSDHDHLASWRPAPSAAPGSTARTVTVTVATT